MFPSNLSSIPDLPKPVARTAATRIWLREEIEAFAVEYNVRRQARLRSGTITKS